MFEIGGETHLDDWARLRSRLWLELCEEAHRAELARVLPTGASGILEFAEASLRTDDVNGCETSPVTFLEGIYVEPAHRKIGIAAALCLAVETWGRAAGSAEMISDADLSNAAGHAFHAAVGFEETERVVFFRQSPLLLRSTLSPLFSHWEKMSRSDR